MDPEIRAQFEETRRHFDGVAERMKAEVQLVAEGVGSIGERLDRLEHNLRQEILRTKKELSAMIKTLWRSPHGRHR